MSESPLEIASMEILSSELPKAESEYISVVWKALSDRILDPEERLEVLEAAKRRGLSKDDRSRLHRLFLKNLALAYLAHEGITDDAKCDLIRLGRLTGVDQSDTELLIIEAEDETDNLAALLLTVVPDGNSQTWSKWILAIPKVGISGLSSAVSASSMATARTASALAGGYRSHCSVCEKESLHRIAVGKNFPISSWGKLLMNSATLSVPVTIAKAAALIASDKKLIAQTGISAIPKFYCTECLNECSAYKSASLLLVVFFGKEK